MEAISIAVANAERIGWEVLAEVMAPPPPVDYVAWAENNIEFSETESQFPGPYNRDLFYYFDEVLRALGPDDPCRLVTLQGSAQIGKTVVANIFCCGSVAMDPGHFLYVHPTDDNAERWSKTKLAPLLRNTASLREIFPLKARDGSDSIHYKERRDGRGGIQISGANSPASLSMVTMKRGVEDDLSKWEMNSAGDPETQADSRFRAHEFAKILKVSTPLVVPGCRISANFELGSQEKLYLPCPHCGYQQTLEWENFLANLDEDHPERAHFLCADPDCGGVIEDYHRAGMMKAARALEASGVQVWRAANPGAMRFHRSFHIWSAYSQLQSFERIAQEWLKARGEPASEKTFFNDTVGRAYKALGESPPWETLRDRGAEAARPRGRIPAGYCVITCGVDCQGDRVEWQVVAWGRDYRRAVIDHGVIAGHISSKECQAFLNGLLTQTFINAHGRRVGIDRLAIDGNAWTEDVWSWARLHPTSKVIMVRGVDGDNAPLLNRVRKERKRDGTPLRYSSRFYNFATSVLKMRLYRNLAKLDPQERGYIDLPRGLEDEFWRQFTAERRVPVRNRSGFISYKWDKDPTQANECLDTHLQAEAAFIRLSGPSGTMLDAVWDAYERERERPPEQQQMDIEDLLDAPVAATAIQPVESVTPQAVAPGRRRRVRSKGVS